jgi:aspartate racemase
MSRCAIGIIGGMGAAASTAFERKLQSYVSAGCVESLDVIHVSMPAKIPDRTEFLLGNALQSPALAAGQIALALQHLALLNHQVLALCVPCNTFHAPDIWNTFCETVSAQALMDVRCVSMMDALQLKMQQRPESLGKIGILCTTGSRLTGLLEAPLLSAGFGVQYVDEAMEGMLMDAIYSPLYGLKKRGESTPESLHHLQRCIDDLLAKNVSGLLFGCSDLALAGSAVDFHGVDMIDPVDALASAVIDLHMNAG